ncbi:MULTISPECIES: DUF397 domain-containing protein [unclassified Streptomyces]|uniref:DUF397 domain-containing protein n=1 Tax=unclassified Streptomyces TaxID=2593676 RepID=UPI0033AD0DCD
MAEEQSPFSWRRSSYSGGGGSNDNQCCEMAAFPEGVWIRDSKQPNGRVLTFTPEAWRSAMAWLSAPEHPGRDHE